MSKKKLTIFIIISVMVIGIVLGFYYVNKSPTEPRGDDGEGTNFFLDLFTFGKGKNNTGDNTDNTNTDISNDGERGEGTEMQKMKLLKISSMPIAGYTVFQRERYSYVPDVINTNEEVSTEIETTEEKTVPTVPNTELVASLRYVAKVNGNIYQTFADEINERRFSSMTIPKVEEAFFGDNGETVVMRYIKENILNPYNTTISTFTGSLPKEFLGGDTGSLDRITGSFLPDNITNLSVSRDGSSMFYIYNTGSKAIGTTANLLGNNKIQVFDSGFTEWLSEWSDPNTITITTKPSANVAGYMYAIDPNRKDYEKILGGINGLTTSTSPNSRFVLYGNNENTLNIYSVENKESKALLVRTLPEKCVWSQNNIYVYCAVPKYIEGASYPDDWYQGEVSFSDDIWKINAESGIATKIIDPLLPENLNIGNQNIEVIDGIKLQLDANEEYLFFVNKIDSHLWGLSLK